MPLTSTQRGVIGHVPRIKAMWFRGEWFDAISVLWRELVAGGFETNDGAGAVPLEGRNGGSVCLDGSLSPGRSITYPIVVAWHFPNVRQQFVQWLHWPHRRLDDRRRILPGCCFLHCLYQLLR